MNRLTKILSPFFILILYWFVLWVLPITAYYATQIYDSGIAYVDGEPLRLSGPSFDQDAVASLGIFIVFHILSFVLIALFAWLIANRKKINEKIFWILAVYWLMVWIIPTSIMTIDFWREGKNLGLQGTLYSLMLFLNWFILGPLLILIPRGMILNLAPGLKTNRNKRFLLIYVAGIVLPFMFSLAVSFFAWPKY